MKKSILIILFAWTFSTNAQDEVYLAGSCSGLYSIDIESCSTQLIGYTFAEFFDIAIHPFTETMYGITSEGFLYEIDKESAGISLIGLSETGLNALTFASDGVLYAMKASSDDLYLIDIENAFATNLGSTGIGVGASGDLTFIEGELYCSTTSDQMAYIDLNDIASSYIIGNFIGPGTVYGITSQGDCEGTVYSFFGNTIYEILEIGPSITSIQRCQNVLPELINGAATIYESDFVNENILGEDRLLCPNESYEVNVSTFDADYVWNDGSTEATKEFTQPGTYWVDILVPGCNFSDSIHLFPADIPTTDFLPADTAICLGDGYYLDHSYIEEVDYWQWGSPDPSKPFGGTVDSFGWYWVEASISGCNVRDSILITSAEEACSATLIFPNIITPNNDGLNDGFKAITADGVTSMSLMIYDRWGQLIYSDPHFSKAWKGVDQNGNEVAEGVYFYVVEYLDGNLLKGQKASHVTLSR